MSKLPYSEGSVFLVPLRSGGFARGVVARSAGKGKVLLGYFFGPRIPSANAAESRDLNPESALLRIRFGDLGLINGEWTVVGTIPQWIQSEWPIPDFVRRDPLGQLKPQCVRYSDNDPSQVIAEFPIEEDIGLAVDSMSGYGAVEIKLTKLLA